ncbi:hypothetical protein E3N88_20802 [Mikania micrantha]|uniref:RNase H type-1 domain-containing protein n=1 Tax=Mikania micrantha TaxID=192012 RepID=A0A5N6NJG5_9ASTR|nr:hypothetical protein E3N88_20802 [Mikania micrantha]
MQIQGAPEVMKISSFINGFRQPQLCEKLGKDFPTTFDSLMDKVRAFVSGKDMSLMAREWELKKGTRPYKTREGGDGQVKTAPYFSKGRSHTDRGRSSFTPYKPPQRTYPKKFTPLTKSPSEILATEKAKTFFQKPQPLRNASRPNADEYLQNLEVYVDDFVVKSKIESDMLEDIEETLNTLRSAQMKLNPEKCSFGVQEGKFLGVMVTKDGIKANPCKVQAIMDIDLPKSLKEAQRLNGRLIALSRFLSWIEERLAKWAIELGDFEISYLPRTAYKGPVLADFLTEAPTDDTTTESTTITAPATKVWQLHTDGSSTNEGNGVVGFILTTPEGVELAYAIRLDFPNTNNEADYEALLARLRMDSTLNVQQLEVHVDSLLVANQMNGLYEAKEDVMKQYLQQAT